MPETTSHENEIVEITCATCGTIEVESGDDPDLLINVDCGSCFCCCGIDCECYREVEEYCTGCDYYSTIARFDELDNPSDYCGGYCMDCHERGQCECCEVCGSICELCNTCMMRSCEWCAECGECYCYCSSCADCGNCPCSCMRDCDCCTCCPCNCGRAGDYIHSYSFRPNFNYWRAESTPELRSDNLFFYGIELEMEEGDIFQAVQDFVDNHDPDGDFLYFKEDGSLGPESAEVVSHPMTLRAHTERDIWKTWFTLVDTYSVQTPSSCGMHIHVSREQLGGQRGESRLTYLLAKYQRRLAKLSRRWNGESTYARWGAFRTDKGEDLKVDDLDYDLMTSTYERYRALNFRNHDTIEFRFFAGTNDIGEFFSNLAITDALCKFSVSDRNLEEVTWPEIVDSIDIRSDGNALISGQEVRSIIYRDSKLEDIDDKKDGSW